MHTISILSFKMKSIDSVHLYIYVAYETIGIAK